MEISANETFKSIFEKQAKPLEPIETGTEPVLKKLKEIKCVAFDFYGTMFISAVGDIGIDDGKADADIITAALDNCELTILDTEAAFMGFDYYDLVVDEHSKILKNQGYENPEPDIRHIWMDVLNSLKQKRLIQGTIDEETVSKFAIEFEIRMNPIWPMPDLLKVITSLKEKKIELAVISNSQFYTPIAFEALTGNSLSNLGFNQQLLHWSFEEKLKKPSVSFYEAFLDKIERSDAKLKPHQILYVGNDMLKDILPAHNMGLKTALFAGDKRSLKWRKENKNCKNLKPDLIITKLNQILDCV